MPDNEMFGNKSVLKSTNDSNQLVNDDESDNRPKGNEVYLKRHGVINEELLRVIGFIINSHFL